MFFVPAILIVPLATILVTVQTSIAEPAAGECKTKPDSLAPAGSHWYYRINRTDQRRCWYLGPEGAKVRSQTIEGATRASSPSRTPAREKTPETTRATPAQMQPAQTTAAEVGSTAAVPDLAAPSSNLPETPDLSARETATMSNSDMPESEPTTTREEMPLIWPVLTEAEHAGLLDTLRESAPLSVFLVGALALLFAGAIFKLARRQTRSHRRGRLRPTLQRRTYSSRGPARPDQVARRLALRTQRDDTLRQRPMSIDPAEARSLRKLMRELQRAAA